MQHNLLSKLSLTFLGKVTSVIAGFLFNIIVIRYLGTEDAGIFFLAHTILLGLAIICRYGMDNAILRHGGEYWGKQNYAGVFQFYHRIIFITLIISAVLSLFIFVSRNYLSVHLFNKEDLAEPLKYIALILWPFSMVWIIGQLYKAIDRPAAGSFLELGSPLILFMAFIFIFKPESMTIIEVILYFGYSCTLVLVLTYIFFYFTTRRESNKTPIVGYSPLIKSCNYIVSHQLLNFFIMWTPTLVLGVLATAEEVAFYSISQRTANLMTFTLLAYNSVAASRIAARHSGGESGSIDRLIKAGAEFVLYTTFPVLLVFLIFPDFILSIFGEDFRQAATALQIIVIGQFINICAGPASILLLMTDHERLLRNNTIITAIFCITSSIVLIYFFGLIGAAIASAISLAMHNVLHSITAYRKLGIITLPDFSILKKYLGIQSKAD